MSQSFTSSKKSPGAYHHGQLRQALIDATLREVGDVGLEKFKVNTLTKRLGVSAAAPFRHFGGRAELLVAAAEYGAGLMMQAIVAAVCPDDDPVAAHRARGVAYVRFCAEHPGVFRLLSSAEILAASEPLQALNIKSQLDMDAVLGRNQQGEAAPELVRRTAGVLAAQALTFGLARMVVDGLLGDLTAAEVERLAWEVTGVLGDGL